MLWGLLYGLFYGLLYSLLCSLPFSVYLRVYFGACFTIDVIVYLTVYFTVFTLQRIKIKGNIHIISRNCQLPPLTFIQTANRQQARGSDLIEHIV